MNIKKSLALWVSIMMVACLMHSCSKEEKNENIVNTDFPKEQGVGNINNPYDYVGITHNDALNEILTMYKTMPSTLRQAIDIAEDYLYEKGYDTAGYYAMVSNIIDNAADNYSSFVSNQNLSSASINIINTLMYDIAKMAIFEQLNNYEDYIDYIKSAEYSIMDNATIPSSEKPLLLSMTSVYRHSFYYWYDYFNEAKLPRWARISIIAGADAAGALVAGPQGAIATSLGAAAVMAFAGEIEAKVDTSTQTVTYII